MSEELQSISDSFTDLERDRLRLEQSVSQLQRSLQHWQIWELEYEGFKEDLLGLNTDAELIYAGATFGGTVLNEKEISLLLTDSQGRQRSSHQVLGLLNNRIDYVQGNVKALEKLLANAEKTVAASNVLTQTDVQSDDGLPLREIREELDDEGNVISISIIKPDDAAPHAIESLSKAGVRQLPTTKVLDDDWGDASTKVATATQTIPKGRKQAEKATPEALKVIKSSGIVGDQDVDLQTGGKTSLQRKKGVTFAEGTKREDATTKKGSKFLRPPTPNGLRYGVENPWQIPLHPYSSTPSYAISNARRAGKANSSKGTESLDHAEHAVLSQSSTAACDIEAPDDEGTSSEEPFSAVMPMEDSPTDALLRRQMIQYNMEDMSAVVAEIDLDDEGSDSWTEEEGDEDYDSISDDEDEDKFGRTKRQVVDDKYRMEMLALEKKLNAKAIHNMGPESSLPESIKKEIGAELMDRENEDICPEPAPSPSLNTSQGLKDVRPKSPTAENSSNQFSQLPQTAKRVSRFKSTQNGSSREDYKPSSAPVPATSTKAPISSTIVERSIQASTTPPNPSGTFILERPFTPSRSTTATELDELDPALLQKQVATEYHHMRNRMIQRQGGFSASAEEEALGGRMRLEEEEEGGRKVSRFKAARLRKV